jgi:hypothetical protein
MPALLPHQSSEDLRLRRAKLREENWQRWGPYLSERQWGTVREDYSSNQDAWNYFPHDHARSRAYRWGEDGLLGICDRQCRLCFSVAFWNGRDPILKERLFGLSGPEGNHGEDVKECYYYLDSTPTHSYMKALYKYPQNEFPYKGIAETNRSRSRQEREYELEETGIFDQSRYFDCIVEYAKEGPDDILIQLTVINRGPTPAALHVLPQLWFRNSWTWGCTHEGCAPKPRLWLEGDMVLAEQQTLGRYHFAADVGPEGERPVWLFTENETNPHVHTEIENAGKYYKDAFHRYVIQGDVAAVDPKQRGTKAAAYYLLAVPAGGQEVLRFRLSSEDQLPPEFFGNSFQKTFSDRKQDADDYYALRIPENLSHDEKGVMRQAYGGLLWTKQFYHYIVDAWINGDPFAPPPPDSRKSGRNSDWPHLFNRDVISMPDKWEYPWYAAWDTAFHMLPMAHLDLPFAQDQLILFLREWYMHPNGQIPAYEWALSDVNPPVHAWACGHVYLNSGPPGQRDTEFLARTFQKLLLNFTWWVNRKDTDGKHVFSGGFLGLDNIGVFDRSKPLPTGGMLNQADGTAWMAFYCGCMLRMALELAAENQAYGDMASKFFEHYVMIAEAMNTLHGTGLWDEEDGFYYDHLSINGCSVPLRIRSLVGLIPLCTSVLLREETIHKLPGFHRRMQWFLANKADMSEHMTYLERLCPETQKFGMRLLAIPSLERFKRMLRYLLDESEFLSPYGIRSLSAAYRDKPFVFEMNGHKNEVFYVPGESDTYMFGGNSNWRGPVWFPLNYLIIESLRTYHEFYGETFKVECPTGSGNMMTLQEVSDEIERRLISIFLPDATGRRPCHGDDPRYQGDENWRELVLFYEYFHGDNGRGLGASHQTGWTALVANMLIHRASRSHRQV